MPVEREKAERKKRKSETERRRKAKERKRRRKVKERKRKEEGKRRRGKEKKKESEGEEKKKKKESEGEEKKRRRKAKERKRKEEGKRRRGKEKKKESEGEEKKRRRKAKEKKLREKEIFAKFACLPRSQCLAALHAHHPRALKRAQPPPKLLPRLQRRMFPSLPPLQASLHLWQPRNNQAFLRKWHRRASLFLLFFFEFIH